MKKKVTLRSRILEHLQDFGSITSFEAFKDYGCTRLSAVIFDLRKMGYPIKSDTRICKWNRYGEPVSFVKYELEEDNMKLFINGKEVKELK